MTLVVVTIAGAALFLWPLWGGALPPSTPALAVVLAGVVALGAVEIGARRLDARRLALLTAVAALDAILRATVPTGIAGWSPVFLLVLCAAYVYGPRYGFLCGSAALLVSAVATGGLGPWVPYEMLGVGWVGAAAGLAGLHHDGPVHRRDIALLAVVAIVTGYAYGAVLDLWDWTMFRDAGGLGYQPGLSPLEAVARFGRYYVTTSLAWDTARAAGNAVCIVAFGAPVLNALERLRTRLTVRVVAPEEFEAATLPAASRT